MLEIVYKGRFIGQEKSRVDGLATEVRFQIGPGTHLVFQGTHVVLEKMDSLQEQEYSSDASIYLVNA
jgi:hypothetical protein